MTPPRPAAFLAILCALCLFGALETALFLYVDNPLSHSIRTLAPSVIDVFKAYTRFGKSDRYLWPSGLGAIFCFALARHKKGARRDRLHATGLALGFFFACVALAGIVADVIKPILGRARPALLDRQDFYGFKPFTFDAAYNSMPSGHAATAFAVAGALMVLWPRGRVLWLAFALAIGLSRVMVNAHYLSDVLAGAALGLLTVGGVRELFRRRGWPIAGR